MPFVEPTSNADPLELFRVWYEDAAATEGEARDVVALATATPAGRPSVRMVLFRGLVDGRVQFFTHLESRKGRELAANPRAALAFHWRGAERQVRIEGAVERLPAATSDAYFASRPRGSQLSAAVSPQSASIDSRHRLLDERRALEARLAGAPVPRPAAWGGFGVAPDVVEFWVSHPDRLHARWRYERDADGYWSMELLAP